MDIKETKHVVAEWAMLFRSAYAELVKNDPLRMAGATAFFTTFALPPILVILIQGLGLVFTTKKIRLQIFNSLEGIIGTDSVLQIISTLNAFKQMASNWYITVLGFVFLLFIATTLFRVIKNSFNQVWKIKVVKSRNVWRSLGARAKSLMVIVTAGILFAIGIFIEGIQAFVGEYIFSFSPMASSYFNTIFHHVFSLFIVMLWFELVFRFLPDGRPDWSVALTGALVTSILFNLGKILLRWLLGYSNINTIYGASGSIVLLLLFVFYSALILYYGVAFTKMLAQHWEKPIVPLPHAKHYQLTEIDEPDND